MNHGYKKYFSEILCKNSFEEFEFERRVWAAWTQKYYAPDCVFWSVIVRERVHINQVSVVLDWVV